MRLLDRLFPARRRAAELRDRLGDRNAAYAVLLAKYADRVRLIGDLTENNTRLSIRNRELERKLSNADDQIEQLTRARDELFNVARERRRLLRLAGIKDKTDTGRRTKPRAELDEVIAVLRDDLAFAKRQAKVYAHALEVAGLPVPEVERKGSHIQALELSRAEREMEAEVTAQQAPEAAEVLRSAQP